MPEPKRHGTGLTAGWIYLLTYTIASLPGRTPVSSPELGQRTAAAVDCSIVASRSAKAAMLSRSERARECGRRRGGNRASADVPFFQRLRRHARQVLAGRPPSLECGDAPPLCVPDAMSKRSYPNRQSTCVPVSTPFCPLGGHLDIGTEELCAVKVYQVVGQLNEPHLGLPTDFEQPFSKRRPVVEHAYIDPRRGTRPSHAFKHQVPQLGDRVGGMNRLDKEEPVVRGVVCHHIGQRMLADSRTRVP